MQKEAVNYTFALQITVFGLYYNAALSYLNGEPFKAVIGAQFKVVPWHITSLSCDKVWQKNTNQALLAAVATPTAHQELAAHLPLAFTIENSFQNAINLSCVIL